MSGPVKRFIAGAVCPACSAMDTIKMYEEDGVPHRECVECGYAESQPQEEVKTASKNANVIGVFKPE